MAQLTNVPSSETNLRLEQRRSYSLGVTLMLKDEQTADITGHVLTFVMAQQPHLGGAPILTVILDHIAPLDGLARMRLQADGLNLDAGEYPYSLVVLTPEGYSGTLMKGVVILEPNTNTSVTGIYTGPGMADTVTITLQDNNRLTLTIPQLPGATLEIGNVYTLPYWQEARAEITGGYPNQLLNLWIPTPGSMNSAVAPSLSNIPPGSVIAVIWDGDEWKIGGDHAVTQRPTTRDDITIHLIDSIGSATQPTWIQPGDLFDQILP